MKRLLSLTVCLMIAMLSFAHSFEVDGIFYNITSSSEPLTVAVTYRGVSYNTFNNEYSGVVDIPKTVTYNGNTYTVTKIGDYAFAECSNSLSVTIPNTVTTISTHAFYHCFGLSAIEIPGSVTYIGDNAFYYCPGLKSLKLNDGIQKLEMYAFGSCDELTSVNIPGSLTSVGISAFPSNLKNVIIEDIAAWCNIDWNLNNNPLVHAQHVYSDEDTEITDLVIPDGVTSISAFSFAKCKSLASVTIPKSVTSIEKSAFYECMGVKSVQISDGVQAIGPTAFSGCSNLTSLIIGKQVTSIPSDAFYNCTALSSVSINSNTILSKDYTSRSTLANVFGTQVKEYNLGTNVFSIGKYAFGGCTDLSTIHIPNTVHTIGSGAFNGCTNLNKVIIDDIGAWCGISFSGSDSNPLRFSNHLYDSSSEKEITELVIPEGIKNINSCAFYNWSELKAVVFPQSLEAIEYEAFYGCSGLTSLVIPKNVVTINNPFIQCPNIVKVTINSNTIMSKEYSSKYPMSSTFGGQVKEYIIGDDVTSIGNYAFNNCVGINSVTIPNSVTSIGNYAFYNCTSMTNVVIPSQVESIGENAFYNCRGLSSISIPDKVASIGKYAFWGCSGITSFELPDNIISVGTVAFDSKNVYVIKGTKTLLSLWKSACFNVYEKGTETFLPAPSLMLSSSTQTTLTLRLGNPYDEYQFKCNGLEFDDNRIQYSGLYPNNSITCNLNIALNDYSIDIPTVFRTRPISPIVEAKKRTSSSIQLSASYTKGDAKVIKQILKLNGISTEGDSLLVRGLNPNSTYQAEYIISVQYGDKLQYAYDYTGTASVTTEELSLTMQEPKVISAGNAVVVAATNIDDFEDNVGFEWRKIDAPESVPSKQGTAAIYGGTMEGLIKNMSIAAGTYYNVRPFYKSSTGELYYGEWIGIDPNEFSYFEPTVHTYTNIDIDNKDITLSGYVMTGSDEVIEQGFEYWQADVAFARSEKHTTSYDIQKIVASGQRMTVTLSNLQNGTTYKYRAYVTTAKGTTYGEEQKFTVPNTTGIESTYNSQSTIHNSAPKGIYTLSGVKVSDDAADLNTLKSGIYIVNGKKVAIK